MVNKKNLFLLGIIISLISISLIISFGFSPDVQGHTADEILINIKGHTMTLEEAITPINYFKYNNIPSSDGTTELISGHDGNEIKIFANGIAIILQTAINALPTDPDVFCSSGSDYDLFDVGHDAGEIWINSLDKTLQDAIDDGDLCADVPEEPICVSNYGASCGGSACVYAGTINCAGTCVGASNKPKLTSCSGGVCISGVCRQATCVYDYKGITNFKAGILEYYSSGVCTKAEWKWTPTPLYSGPKIEELSYLGNYYFKGSIVSDYSMIKTYNLCRLV